MLFPIPDKMQPKNDEKTKKGPKNPWSQISGCFLYGEENHGKLLKWEGFISGHQANGGFLCVFWVLGYWSDNQSSSDLQKSSQRLLLTRFNCKYFFLRSFVIVSS